MNDFEVELTGRQVPRRQRGGMGDVRSWLVTLLLVAGLASAAANVYQYRHRVIIEMTVFKHCVAPTV
jgi:hypothetical protein